MAVLVAVGLLSLGRTRGAETDIPETVPVGDPGNRSDSTTFGAVAYPYRIGAYEVTNAQYCAFLNAVAKTDTYGLYNAGMAGEYGGIKRSGASGQHAYHLKDGMGAKPVGFVSWYDALRYANWLTNGRGDSGTETGSYVFSNERGSGGARNWTVTMPDHAALAAGKDAKWVLASENEWYKAAYYDPVKPGGPGYWPYAAKTANAPAANINSNAPSDVGSHKDSASAYGTYDQNGNMWEWNETQGNGKCGVRGGSFYLNDNAGYMLSSTRYVSNPPTFEHCNYGFRVVLLGGAPGAIATPATPASQATPATAATADPVKRPAAEKRATPATFYVSQSSGNDNWTGTAEQPGNGTGPWKTLARASSDYIPGDRILLKCGDTWNEEFHPKGSGTPEKPITIASYGKGAKPVIDRQDAQKDLIGIRLSDQEGFKIVGIEFARCMTGIYAEYPDNTPTRKYIWIEDCYFRDSLKYGDYKNYPNPRNIGLGICFFSYECDKRIVLTDITIRKCVFRRLASAVWTNSPDNFNKNASFVYNFGNMNFEDCLFEEGYQWQQGIRGVDKGSMRNCVTHDIGRGFRAWNGVAGSMFFRCKDWVFEDCEWGFVDIGLGSGDGEAFDFEGNCDNMTMRNCLFHDTDGPGFLLCCYASDGNPNRGIRMENCVLNGKAKRPIRPMPKAEIINTTDWTEVTWENCRFYLSPGEVLMKVMDPEKDKKSSFVKCVLKNLSAACSTSRLAARLSASGEVAGHEAAKAGDGNATTAWKAVAAGNQWLQLDFGKPTTVNEFRLKEAPGSSINRYVIEYWDEKTSKWVSCFNGMAIGADFVAPIVGRPMQKARLTIVRTAKDSPAICAFEAYNDTTGHVFDARGRPPDRVPAGSVSPGRVPVKSADATPAKPAERVIPWDMPALSKAPKVHPANARPAKEMRSFFYEGADYKGKPTWVFAYYAAPQGNPPAGGWPAVVCAHGGGGTAYPEWVRKWNGRGYAAIAMDLEGHLPGGKSHQVEGNFPTGEKHQNAGPARIDYFGDRDLPDTEQWFYHAVADVIRAHSLLRTFPEINPEKIGLTGISWGGVIVSTVAGVDPRFAFVVPVYGGGFIHESDNPGLAQWFPPRNMTPKQFQDYRTKWDPSAHLPHARMPMLFVTSVADPVFQINIFAKSAQTAGGPSILCMRPWMIHGHGNGWNDPVEIGQFADSVAKDGPPLPKLERPEIKPDSGMVHTKFTGKDKITEAWIYFTTSGGQWAGRKWQFIQCTIGEKELVSQQRLPPGTTAFMVYVFRDVGGQRSNHSASELVVLKP